MRKKTEGLTFPKNPMAAMRSLQDLDERPTPPEDEVETEENMTSHITNKKISNEERQPENNVFRKPEDKQENNAERKQTTQIESLSSVKQTILQAVQSGSNISQE